MSFESWGHDVLNARLPSKVPEEMQQSAGNSNAGSGSVANPTFRKQE